MEESMQKELMAKMVENLPTLRRKTKYITSGPWKNDWCQPHNDIYHRDKKTPINLEHLLVSYFSVYEKQRNR